MMVAQWMLYSVLIAGLVTAAALVVEWWFRSAGRAVRWVWAGASVASLLVPVIALLTGGRYPGRLVPWPASTGSWADVLSLVGPGAEGATVQPGALVSSGPFILSDGAVAAAWLLSTLAAAAWYAGVWRRLTKSSRTWRRARVAGSAVLVSRNGGPAAVGLVRPSIVVPEWLLRASDSVQRVVLLHESEHLRSRDHALLALSPLLVILFPWNVVLWWQLRRLRLAVELDCDRRVLASGVDVGLYASLLLQIAARPRGPVLGASLARPERRPLEARLKAMTRGPLRWRRLRMYGAIAAAVLILVVACEADPPLTPDALSALAESAKAPDFLRGADRQLEELIDGVDSGRVVAYVDGVHASREDLDRLKPDDIASIEIRKSAFDVPGKGVAEVMSGRVDIRTKQAANDAAAVDEFRTLVPRTDGEKGIARDMHAQLFSAPGAGGQLARLMEAENPLDELPADGDWYVDDRPVSKSEARSIERSDIARIEVKQKRQTGSDVVPEVRIFTRGGDGG